jgi:hypothetical protein
MSLHLLGVSRAGLHTDIHIHIYFPHFVRAGKINIFQQATISF